MKQHQLVDVLVDGLKRIGLRRKRDPLLYSAQKQKVQKVTEIEKMHVGLDASQSNAKTFMKGKLEANCV